MQFAEINYHRVLAKRGLQAVCPLCKTEVVPHCGHIVVHHWQHKARAECDPWWENETLWHRGWKDLFNREQVEVSLNGAPYGGWGILIPQDEFRQWLTSKSSQHFRFSNLRTEWHDDDEFYDYPVTEY